MIRGRKLDKAIKMLEEVIEIKRPVPFARYNMGVAHKAGVGPGRYPKKSAQAILRALRAQSTMPSTRAWTPRT